MIIKQIENPMNLCDRNEIIFQIGHRVEVKYLQYSDPKIVCNIIGVIDDISPNKPHIAIYCDFPINIFNGKSVFCHRSNWLDFYHFSKTSKGIWISSQIKELGNFFVPLYAELITDN